MRGLQQIIKDNLRDSQRFPNGPSYLDENWRNQYFSTQEGLDFSLECINEYYSQSAYSGWDKGELLFDVSKKTKVRDHFILLDCHTHFVKNSVAEFHNQVIRKGTGYLFPGVRRSGDRRMTEKEYLRYIFLDSNTDYALLTHVPEMVIDGIMPTVSEMTDFKKLVADKCGRDRILVSGNIYIDDLPNGRNRINYPNSPEDLEVSAYKIYPPRGQGVNPNWLNNNFGNICRGINRLLDAGKTNLKVCIHRHDENRDLVNKVNAPNDPLSLKLLARTFPTVKFIVFHSCYDGFTGLAGENYYFGDPKNENLNNVNFLIDAVKSHKNIYIETGMVLHHMFAVNPPLAQKFINELLKDRHVAKRCLWGTDSPWYGPPQWQVNAFDKLVVKNKGLKTKMLYTNGPRLFKLSKPTNRDLIDEAREEYQNIDNWPQKTAFFESWFKQKFPELHF